MQQNKIEETRITQACPEFFISIDKLTQKSKFSIENIQSMEDPTKEFWEIYDQYIETGEIELRSQLSSLLAKIEGRGKEEVKRPEKEWNKPLGWQVIRQETLIFSATNFRFSLLLGEVILWEMGWDREAFISRIPRTELVAGTIVRPGYHYQGPTEGEPESYGNNKLYGDCRGVFLPIFSIDTLEMMAFDYIEINKMSLKVSLALEREKPWFQNGRK